MARLRTTKGPGEAGFTLIEVMTSAIMVVIISTGVFGAIQSMTKASAQERTRATAHALAQGDQSRMRNFKIADLANYSGSRDVVDGGTTFTVDSRTTFVSDATGTATCEENSTSADYIRVTSTVTWPTLGSRPPVVLQSTIAPPNGSIAADAGALAVRVEDATGAGLAGIGISGTGAGGFSGQTNNNGCVIFGNLPAGNYDLVAATGGLVNRDGEAATAQTASVIPFATNVVVLQYDQPGSIGLDFTTFINGALQPSSADSVVVFNTGMSGPKVYGTVGSPQANMTISPLFPFSSPNAAYAGTCEGNNPNPTAQEPPPASQASLLVPAGGTISGTIQLPALDIRVFTGNNNSNPGVPLAGAQIKLIDNDCDDGAGQQITRDYISNSLGVLDDPGVPRSHYDVCVFDGINHRTFTDRNVQSLTSAHLLNVYTTNSNFDIPGPC